MRSSIFHNEKGYETPGTKTNQVSYRGQEGQRGPHERAAAWPFYVVKPCLSPVLATVALHAEKSAGVSRSCSTALFEGVPADAARAQSDCFVSACSTGFVGWDRRRCFERRVSGVVRLIGDAVSSPNSMLFRSGTLAVGRGDRSCTWQMP